MASPPSGPIVSLRGVGKIFGTGTQALDGVGKTFANGVVALDRLDLDVRPGEFVSLLGPSGCGKSTALRIISGLSEPSRGTIAWPQPEAARAAGPRRIGFVFQEPTLMPWATVAANVRLPLKLAGLKPDAPARIDAALARVGLAGFIDPTAGTIEMDGKVLSSPAGSLPPERRDMSMIFQSYAIWPNMTVEQNVAFGLELRRISADEVRRRGSMPRSRASASPASPRAIRASSLAA